MDFKKITSKPLIPILGLVLVVVLVVARFMVHGNTVVANTNDTAAAVAPVTATNDVPVAITQIAKQMPLVAKSNNDVDVSEDADNAIQQQFDQDREAQKETKFLKMKLEQTNLELDQEKAMAEIDKLKSENVSSLHDSDTDPKTLPEVKVVYIGGNASQRSAILSIGGANYQVTENSYPVDHVQVLSITDSDVTLHFTAPKDLTKIFEYKQE